MNLILPHIKYKDSFLAMAFSLQSENHWWGVDPKEIQKDFAAYLEHLAQSSGKEYWILDNELIVGRLKLNYELTEGMKIRGGHIGYGISAPFRKRGLATQALGKALQIAKERGMKEIVMTCDDDNVASIAVIEKNSGILQDKVIADGRSVYARRYLIKIL